jgi:lysozyme
MAISQVGRDFIKKWEGFVPRVYKDIANIGTVCWGHVITSEDGRTFDDGATVGECEDVYARDLGKAERAVDSMVKVSLGQHHKDALISFVFNCGTGALKSSMLLQRLNRGEYNAVPGELLKWCKYVDPKTGTKMTNQGLYNRRRSEGDLWESPDAEAAQAVASGELSDDEKTEISNFAAWTATLSAQGHFTDGEGEPDGPTRYA